MLSAPETADVAAVNEPTAGEPQWLVLRKPAMGITDDGLDDVGWLAFGNV
jgi:hypothetical protein